MNDVRRVSAEEAAKLLEQGYRYIDVRTEREFEQGHVPGALNVPIDRPGPGAAQPNPDFLRVMAAAFEKTDKLLIGCRSGPRSLRAARELVQGGFGEVVELENGFDGRRDAFGRLLPGWSRKGLPIETGRPAGRTYADVARRAGVNLDAD